MRGASPEEVVDPPKILGRVLIVDDSAPFRRAARLLLTAEGVDVVGEAATAAAALGCTSRLRPDLVLLDVSLPDGSGLETAARLSELRPPARIIVISSREDAGFHDAAHQSGAVGFLPKSRFSVEALATMLSTAARG